MKHINKFSDEVGTVNSVTSVIRALNLLRAFDVTTPQLNLAELSRITGLHKTTALRLARTLASQNYLVQQSDGEWRLGRAAGALGASYQETFDVHDVVAPVLRKLAASTGESASFYVREGNERTCLARIDSLQADRHSVRIGITLPLKLGAPGRVILAFSGEPGEPYESIRKNGFHLSMGEREPEISSVAAPIFDQHFRLLGSICISGPTNRLSKKKLNALAKTIMTAGQQLSRALARSQRDKREVRLLKPKEK